ncbi:hypothetical protein CSUI_006203 [Cystoisospora suis]|uniref:Transmembrane protein n=1 Tax=Cystoisospora suis TaxID=483139 RepID=A0A2C6KV75_9APIC|nr:hypothetical protein CSUI_006203 [Cystoisospora suis]
MRGESLSWTEADWLLSAFSAGTLVLLLCAFVAITRPGLPHKPPGADLLLLALSLIQTVLSLAFYLVSDTHLLALLTRAFKCFQSALVCRFFLLLSSRVIHRAHHHSVAVTPAAGSLSPLRSLDTEDPTTIAGGRSERQALVAPLQGRRGTLPASKGRRKEIPPHADDRAFSGTKFCRSPAQASPVRTPREPARMETDIHGCSHVACQGHSWRAGCMSESESSDAGGIALARGVTTEVATKVVSHLRTSLRCPAFRPGLSSGGPCRAPPSAAGQCGCLDTPLKRRLCSPLCLVRGFSGLLLLLPLCCFCAAIPLLSSVKHSCADLAWLCMSVLWGIIAVVAASAGIAVYRRLSLQQTVPSVGRPHPDLTEDSTEGSRSARLFTLLRDTESSTHCEGTVLRTDEDEEDGGIRLCHGECYSSRVLGHQGKLPRSDESGRGLPSGASGLSKEPGVEQQVLMASCDDFSDTDWRPGIADGEFSSYQARIYGQPAMSRCFEGSTEVLEAFEGFNGPSFTMELRSEIDLNDLHVFPTLVPGVDDYSTEEDLPVEEERTGNAQGRFRQVFARRLGRVLPITRRERRRTPGSHVRPEESPGRNARGGPASNSTPQTGLQPYRSTPSHEVHRKRKQLLVLIFVDGFCAAVSQPAASYDLEDFTGGERYLPCSTIVAGSLE